MKHLLSLSRLATAAALVLIAYTAGAETFAVINTNDSGAGSLSQAITDANNAPGDDAITFSIPGAGPHVIGLSNPLPTITSNISIINDAPGDEAVAVRKNDSTVIQFEIFRINAGGPNPGPTVLISGLTVSNGVGGSQGGGAINNAASTLTLRNCTLSNNQAFHSGGAILNFGTNSPGRLTMINCTMNANTSGSDGGAIRNLSVGGSVSEISLTNCTLSGHTSGTILNEKNMQSGVAKVTLTNCTFANNRSVDGSKASNISNNGGTVEMVNTIFARTSGAAPNFTGSGTFTSLGHNLADDAAGGDAGTSPGGILHAAGDIRNSDPQLNPLANNGGLTATHALLESSPAINAGDDAKAPQQDQRGSSRFGASDIGSFESPFASGVVGNVATRLPVGTGDNALIQGFIVQGPVGSTKKIMVRALGPFLTQFGITDALANPTLSIHGGNVGYSAVNNDWRTTQVGGNITGDQSAEIASSGLAPSADLESAIIAHLSPGDYTAVVRGVGNTTGTGIVDAYDMSPGSPARLANIATRGLVQPGDKLMIAGFIIQHGSVRTAVRAIGPSLQGITNALPDTTLQLRNKDGMILLENDDWKTDPAQKQELESSGLQPSHDLEAALITTIQPGEYTAQVRGKGQDSGIGVVEVYFLQ